MSGLSLKPQGVTDELWYYEEPRGIEIIHEIRVADHLTGTLSRYVRTDHILIPWRKIRASLRRKDAELAKKARP